MQGVGEGDGQEEGGRGGRSCGGGKREVEGNGEGGGGFMGLTT